MSSQTHSPHSVGGCLCKAIRYTLASAPTTTVLCHCANCQKASGSAFMTNNWYKLNDFSIASGHQSLRSYQDANAATGAIVKRYFCGECGSPLYITNNQYPDSVIVTNGTVDGKGVEGGEWRPVKEFHCNERAGWMPEVEGTERFDDM
ncbi:MAG: hypothetical protein M1820_002130 [Bogoriella megaspora]|nr:MAG: hypothetical protein M1820_002130 [Bogoriella megaspora]